MGKALRAVVRAAPILAGATAALLLETTSLAWYFPVLCLSGTVAGVCIGLLAALLVQRIPEA